MVEQEGKTDFSTLTPERRENHNLLRGVFLVEGAKRAALYDTNTGSVYSINREAVEAIKEEDNDQEFRSKLISLNLVHAQEVLEMESTALETEIPKPVLQFAWLEITDKCNERCLHCYGNFSPGGRETFSKSLSHDEWKNIIHSLAINGCSQIQFIGGEPFKYRGAAKELTVLDLVEFARECGIEFIEIFTNGTLVSEEAVKRIKELGIQIAISLYSSDPNIHDFVTQTPGSYKKTIRSIGLLKEADIPVRAAVIVMKQNQNTIEETLQMVQRLGLNLRMPDVVRPTGRAQMIDIMPNVQTLLRYGLISKPNFLTDPISFHRNHFYHTCLAGKIAITTEGKVIPCIFSRNQTMGDLKEQELEEILQSEKLDENWKSTKDKVLVCRDCEYRYACFDCRPLAEGSGCGSYTEAPFPRCTYNPYNGQWGMGIWKINNHGEIVYEDLSKICE